MIENTIKSLSGKFLNEAQNSPQLLEDMAAMEKYMAESYGERIFIELLQNADDAGSTKIKLFNNNGHVFFANNGKEFDGKDIESISRSGASSKERGNSIGYRGVGFKSTCYLTNEILIYSDKTYFTFSKVLCAKKLNIHDLRKVPTIRIPFELMPNEIEKEVNNTVSSLIKEGYTSVFIFKNARLDLLLEEIKLVDDGYFLFLRNVCSVEIKLEKNIINYQISREIRKNEVYVSLDSKTKQSWLVINSEHENNISLAFRMNNVGKIVKCSSDEAVFHCYLPTLEKTGYSFKINSDFSTDPSRKHLTLDIKTEKAIHSVSELLFYEVVNLFNGNSFEEKAEIIELITSKNSFSKFAALLSNKLYELLKDNQWLILENGDRISPNLYKKPPSWLEVSEFNLIRQYSRYVVSHSPIVFRYNSSNVDFNKLLKELSVLEYEVEDLIYILSEKDFIEKIDELLLGKIYGYLIKFVRSKSLYNVKFPLKQCLIKNQSITSIYELNNNDNLSEEFRKSFKENSYLSDVAWFDKEYGTKFAMIFDDNEINSENKNEKNISIFNPSTLLEIKKNKTVSKWRAAEQQCVEFENTLGNAAKDVSKQNLGYDIESIDDNGKVRYIEVKSISKSNPYFSMTNNEYTAAHQLGDNYYICVINQEDEKLKLLYIRNPINNLKLEKRVRQWEWICEEYSGEQFIIELN